MEKKNWPLFAAMVGAATTTISSHSKENDDIGDDKFELAGIILNLVLCVLLLAGYNYIRNEENKVNGKA